jgi:hypothetical protein
MRLPPQPLRKNMMNTILPVRLLRRTTSLLLVLVAGSSLCSAGTKPDKKAKITTPKEALGFNLGDDYQMASYTQLEAYWKQLASESDRLKLVDIGLTAENRHQYMMVISASENMRKLDHYKQISQQLAHAENLTEDQAHALAREGKAVVWIDGGLHANETVGSQQEMEWVYQMASRDDAETMRFLNDTILLCTLANPDGQELVANWYMREKDPMKRSMEGLPTLFQKYIGHDNNRDFYMSNMPESTNMNRQMFIEWFPQIVYNHHQTGPAGAVIFMPPFRDPFNYNFDPLIPLDVEAVGTAMHQRLVEEGKGGSAQRSGANYSTWWNGGLRTIAYFHNMIGLLTEIIGSPTPMNIALVPDKQLPSGDWPLPIAPQQWHYRQSIDYEMTNNRAVTDYASRNRETLLYNLYLMGHRSIQNGSEDHWTITPDRIEALKASAAGNETMNKDLYNTVLHDPAKRDPRGYVIPSDQADFPTATKFVNTLLKNGITVMQASAPFSAGVQKFPAGSYVIKTAQAFRPHVMDMFEPQHHPNDFQYPGGPPIPPYDSAGWTLALQMGVQFSRIMEPFDGPFTKIDGLLKPPSAAVAGVEKPAGYLVSHRINDSFVLINRLLKANCDVYWVKKAQMIDGRDFGTGSIWVPATSDATPIVQQAAKTLGVEAVALASAPAGASVKLKPQRIALFDQYGGLMPSGWDRWLFEQFEFPFQVVYPQTLDAGDLKNKFDVIVFTDGAFRARGNNPDMERYNRQPDADKIPEQYRAMLGNITENKTIPALKKFVESGGSIIAVGSATRMAKVMGVPIDSYLDQMGADGKEHPLAREKYYIPGSLLKMDVDTQNPLAYGMPDSVDVFFDNSPVFRLLPSAPEKRSTPVGWFSTAKPLVSGWAWGQQYLDGGTAVAEASLGEGKIFLFGPEITFRGQPHATFKFLFNAIDYADSQPVTLQ